jgi:hypothetical protein
MLLEVPVQSSGFCVYESIIEQKEPYHKEECASLESVLMIL